MSGKAYQSEYRRMTAIIDCMGDGVIAVDKDGLVNYMNSSAEQITGWKQEEALGAEFSKVFSLIDAETKKALPSPLTLVDDAGGSVGLFPGTMLVCRTGNCKYISASCAAIKDNRGGKAGSAIVFRDITRKKKAEEQLRKAKEEAEAASRAKSEFLANISHEIRTPINGILGMIDLTLMTDLSEEQLENLLIAKNCANSLLSIINDILDFSKMDAGKIQIEYIPFALQDLVSEIARPHAVAARRKKLRLELDFSPQIPKYIKGDPNRLRQIIDNLLSNAVKFTEKGSITLSVRKTPAGPGEEREWLLFSVKDTGIGIARKNMGKLFKSFSQIDSSTTRQFGGTGLGLVICKQLVEQQGGKIWVTSELQKGSTFSFTLPLVPGKEPKEKPERKAPFTKTARPLRILLVEDDKVNCQVMSQLLKEKGHLVDLATSGRQAIKLHDTNTYDIILMDILMPGMDGIETTAKIREKEGKLRHTPVIALTAFSLKGDRERFLSLGMDEYIAKPVDLDELCLLLDKIAEDQDKKRQTGKPDPESGDIMAEGKAGYDRVKPLLPEINQNLQLLVEAAETGNLAETEKYAHLLKNVFITIDAEKLKYSAFRVELAARRGDRKAARELAECIRQAFATYRKGF